MTPSPFECPFPGCGLSYRRKEHLTRHAKLHSKSQSFECPFCDRSFARSDTLRHHVRSYHPDKELKSSRATRACNYCRARRSKCNGNDPCNRCVRLGKKCSYSEQSQRELLRSRTNSNSIARSEGLESSPCRVAPYVQAYFDNFHAEWPFLHPATFEHTREPAFLLQSVTMMGMWVTREKSAQERAKELHKKLISCIYEQRDNWAESEDYGTAGKSPHICVSDSPAWPLATYQGILLQMIFSLLQNQEPPNLDLASNLPKLPSQLLRALVRSCCKRNILFYPSILSQFDNGENPEVFVWVGIEEVKRFALSLYRICQRVRLHDPRELDEVPDYSPRAVSCRSGRHLLSLADLQFALPDSDELWHMTSGLAARLAGRSAAYADANMEEHWISHAVRLLQPQGEQFGWI